MFNLGKTSRTLCAAYIGASFAVAEAKAAEQPYITIGKLTSQPVGHAQFCRDLPFECAFTTTQPMMMRIDQQSWDLLVRVNNAVNTIPPATDQQIYGVEEFWNYPQGVADCEDYALEKRRQLIANGWAESALFIAVVRNNELNGAGHAILMARTDRGDFVLDNLDGKVRRWDEIGQYEFVKVIDPQNNGQWRAVIHGRSNDFTASVPAP